MNSLKYLAAYTIPISAFIGVNMEGYWSFLTPLYAFVAIPLLEILLAQDAGNLTESARASKRLNPIYDLMLFVNIPIVFVLIWLVGTKISTGSYDFYEYVGFAFSLGIVLGTNGINVAHELGHRQGSVQRFLGKLLLLPSFYMHFYIEHNFGHHVHAATPEDPATARYNQSVYHFWVTSVFRQYINAWRIQRNLLKKESATFFSFKNDMFWYAIIQLAYIGLLYVVFGGFATAFLMLCGIIGFLLLETVNYIEHYGLLRLKRSSGRYERVQEIHSWNSNHVIGRIVLYELTRHSDHHFKSSKKYQLLDYHNSSPDMPYGYPTSMVLSLIPPLWFRIMNPRIPKEMKPA
ncbi:alkane 1-monooxygenase [Robiginitalea aurantiaca]|uniref:Alkane 1-monooxygenase n=1 Tax=Robiginitalea aurantiaca TaxID=3056915 RepID=A0ABT7WAL9_9FLAO|nr:alkane 1-monooxygenase [Robiginitalea aurantiaca]MDM9629874.1 alkane 1-monooxygenase [Robiginitalea aurantiaca]